MLKLKNIPVFNCTGFRGKNCIPFCSITEHSYFTVWTLPYVYTFRISLWHKWIVWSQTSKPSFLFIIKLLQINKWFRELEFVIKYHRRRSKKQLENRGLYQNCNKCMFECNCKSADGDGQVHFHPGTFPSRYIFVYIFMLTCVASINM